MSDPRPRFALIGAAGYIAPRHMKAIRDVGGDLVAITDPHDSVGIVDRYFPNAVYFRETELFFRHLDTLRRDGNDVDYVVICSPNHLHAAHASLALVSGSNVICEKPVVLDPEDIERLRNWEAACGKRVWTILQLRLHENARKLREIATTPSSGRYEVSVHYATPRGHWYESSWKGDPAKSGGIVMNIGVHLFDLLVWLFGETYYIDVHPYIAAGSLTLKRAQVSWSLTTRPDHREARRTLRVNGECIDLSSGFEDLHTKSYRRILAGEGFGLEDARGGIELVERIRRARVE